MEEILIEEKKYISSKQAAKITGYAKDYVGQLCREGRVPARLVGRSWYVLESAIQDHRFGDQEIDLKKEIIPGHAETEASSTSRTAPEFPRYEASHLETLPTLNRLHKVEETSSAPEEKPSTVRESPQSLQESWKEWFDHVSEPQPAVVGPSVQEAAVLAAPEKSERADAEPESAAEEDTQGVPLHVERQYAPSEIFSPRELPPEHPSSHSPQRRGGSKLAVSLQTAGVLLAAAAATLAVIGSGYFDSQLTSGSQV